MRKIQCAVGQWISVRGDALNCRSHRLARSRWEAAFTTTMLLTFVTDGWCKFSFSVDVNAGWHPEPLTPIAPVVWYGKSVALKLSHSHLSFGSTELEKHGLWDELKCLPLPVFLPPTQAVLALCQSSIR